VLFAFGGLLIHCSATGAKEHEIHQDVHFCFEQKETLENKGKMAMSGLQHDSSRFILRY
jgi:hypothetical protein